MSTQPVHGFDLVCENCAFSVAMRIDPKDVRSALVCKFMPPSIVAMPIGNGQVNVQAIDRIVAPKSFCFQHRPKPVEPVAPSAAND